MLARWQFATTTVYHFLIVPISIGLTVLVAVMQTLAYRRRGTPSGELWERSTRFWGRIMLVLFALGVVTGIVQEFQFGMNWSAYSRFVGDVFGAPLAMEGLIAFFLESTFLGLWVFGRTVLSPRTHLATIWLAAIGTNISAYFILAANSFMQHPWGVHYNPETRRIELSSIWKVLTNSTQLVTFPHTIFAAFMTASALLVTVSAWHLRRSKENADPVHRAVAKLGLGVLIVSAVGVSFVGHVQGQIMTDQQPMKMAAAEALWHTEKGADFSLFAYAPLDEGTKGDNSENKFNLTIPNGLSILAKNRADATVQGIDEVGKAEAAKYGATTGLTSPASYVPVVWLAYWTFRLMIGLGVLAALIGVFLARPADEQRRPAAGRHLDDRAAAAGEHRRLAVHRDGAPAVGGLRLPDHGGRCQHQRRQRLRADDARAVHRAVRRARRRLLPHRAADRDGRPGRARTAHRGGGERRTRDEPGLRGRSGCCRDSGSA
jgi:cytochrome d ubiquinol oxidase subunit I